jgi:shikimate dehydrogenase
MRAAVLGSPIAHSLSPVLHTAAYRELGLTGWTYEAIECDAAGLSDLLHSLGPDWAGLSLTMPLKRAVLPLLDWADPVVAEVGAANTVLLRGGRSGYNTDVPGIATALDGAGVTAGKGGEPVLVLGGGATACSAIAALRRAKVESVLAAVRDPATAHQLRNVARVAGMRLDLVAFGPGAAREDWLARYQGRVFPLLLSTVPAGAADDYAGLIAAGALSTAAVFDVVYDPWPTRLAAAATAAGLPVISGFELLLRQAAGQVELMTGEPAPVPAMRAAGLAVLAARF